MGESIFLCGKSVPHLKSACVVNSTSYRACFPPVVGWDEMMKWAGVIELILEGGDWSWEGRSGRELVVIVSRAVLQCSMWVMHGNIHQGNT